ncbi:uncharacterized protein PV09_06155 [Verruconis gallopava]|uniref:Galactose oxidase-like Early set domain-containing protein n=1 Tax=Verruconis gallopava TaxID=253628 RepID=A0A0D1XK58_9PEZI|nr:uncharacterized protein PV09_06155 [Verruconis gallopava]KIW02721.1 hypothetical protein PV09_06155 [Verruconis gallopava]
MDLVVPISEIQYVGIGPEEPVALCMDTAEIAHCGAGCQSGPCLLNGAVEAPSAKPASPNPIPGTFQVIGDSGVPVMHAALLPNGHVVFIDKVENYTKLILPNGRFAYAAEWDPLTAQVTALSMKTNAFCSAGTFLADGTLLSIGGNGPLESIDPTVGDGYKSLRTLRRSINDRSFDGQSFAEAGNLSSARWYASAQILSDGRIFVASGSLNGLDPTVAANNNPTYEILSQTGTPLTQSTSLDILLRNQPYYMYPFIHLLRTGDLFVFTSKSSELWSPVIKSALLVYPDLPGEYRTYPNTGTSVLLPLSSDNHWDPEVIICGGGAYQDLASPTDPSCGRIAPLAENPKWEMDAMPEGRAMVEGVLLPDGTIVFLNGCNQGAQGFLLATKPTLDALLYDPNAPLGQRWTTLARSSIPRLYHSVALLLLDGTIMIAGSNPVEQPVLKATADYPFTTEFRVEIYTPPYLSGENANKRPINVTLSETRLKANGSYFSLSFKAPSGANQLKVCLYHGGFVTHSLHMGQRMMFLDTIGWETGQSSQIVNVTMPPSNNVAPPGPYVLYVLVDGIPSVGQFVMVS